MSNDRWAIEIEWINARGELRNDVIVRIDDEVACENKLDWLTDHLRDDSAFVSWRQGAVRHCIRNAQVTGITMKPYDQAGSEPVDVVTQAPESDDQDAPERHGFGSLSFGKSRPVG